MADFAPHDLTSVTSHSPYFVSASSYNSDNYPWKAFDGAGGGKWLGQKNGIDWLRIFTQNKYVLESYEIEISTEGLASRGIKDWTMQGSNDGITWSTLDTVSGETSWTSGQKRSYTCDTATTAYCLFKLNITANNGDKYSDVKEVYLYGTAGDTLTDLAPHDLTSDTSHSPYVTSASSYQGTNNPWKAFDGIGGISKWLGEGDGTCWLKIDLGSSSDGIIGSYGIRLPDESLELARAPKDWTLEGSNDDSNWSTLDTVSGSASWGNCDIRIFGCDAVTSAYRYIRLNITANYNNTYTAVEELYLFGEEGETTTTTTTTSTTTTTESSTTTTTTESSTTTTTTESSTTTTTTESSTTTTTTESSTTTTTTESSTTTTTTESSTTTTTTESSTTTTTTESSTTTTTTESSTTTTTSTSTTTTSTSTTTTSTSTTTTSTSTTTTESTTSTTTSTTTTTTTSTTTTTTSTTSTSTTTTTTTTTGMAVSAYYRTTICAEVRGFSTGIHSLTVAVCEEVRGFMARLDKTEVCMQFDKDPGATMDYWIDWADTLDSGETLATSAWAADSPITVVRSYIQGTKAYVFLSGGVDQTTYVVVNTVTTSAGNTYVGEFKLKTRYR